MGAGKFVLFGSCGVLDDEKTKGKIIIPVSAVRDEGTSYHYMAPSSEITANPRSVQTLETVLTACSCPYVKAVLMSKEKPGPLMQFTEKPFQ